MSVNLPRGSIIRNGILYNGGAGGSFYETTPVTALSGATTVTIQDSHIHATSLVVPFADDGSSVPMAAPSSITLTEGQCVLTVDSLETDTEFTLVILSGNGSGGGGGGASNLADLQDVAITNPTTGQLLKLNGTTWVNADDPVTITPAVTAIMGATSCTITNSAIHTTSLIEPLASIQGMGQPTMTITEGECLLEFPALAQDTSFRLRITN